MKKYARHVAVIISVVSAMFCIAYLTTMNGSNLFDYKDKVVIENKNDIKPFGIITENEIDTNTDKNKTIGEPVEINSKSTESIGEPIEKKETTSVNFSKNENNAVSFGEKKISNFEESLLIDIESINFNIDIEEIKFEKENIIVVLKKDDEILSKDCLLETKLDNIILNKIVFVNNISQKNYVEFNKLKENIYEITLYLNIELFELRY